MAIICRIGDYYLYRGDPCISESSVLQTTLKASVIAALFFVGYALGRHSSNVSEEPLTSVTFDRSQNSSRHSLDSFDDADTSVVSISSSHMRGEDQVRRSISQQDNSGQASSANFLNAAASTATYASKHSSANPSRSATPPQAKANPLGAFAAQEPLIVNGGISRLNITAQSGGITPRPVNLAERTTPETFSRVSSCSSASTAQVIEDGEFVMVPYRNGSQSTSTLTSPRRE